MVADGTYFIFHDHAGYWSYLVLDVPSGRPDDHVVIQQFLWHGGSNQQWLITNLPGGFVTITSVHTGKALDIPWGRPIVGMKLQQFTPNGGPNQQWRLETTPAFHGEELHRPEYHRIFNRQSELDLDVPNGSQASRVKRAVATASRLEPDLADPAYLAPSLGHLAISLAQM